LDLPLEAKVAQDVLDLARERLPLAPDRCRHRRWRFTGEGIVSP
jgi:hypothetical protein